MINMAPWHAVTVLLLLMNQFTIGIPALHGYIRCLYSYSLTIE
jgi:hypothetical protein